jgi:hypothetical protein
MEPFGQVVWAWGSLAWPSFVRPMYKVWGKKTKNLFWFFCIRNGFYGFLDVFWRFFFVEVGKSCHDPCIRYGGKKIENFFFVSYALKMILNVFWTCFDDFCFSRSANPLHGSMYKVWGEKNRKFFFVSYALKMILNVFWTCFDDFWFSRSANPIHLFSAN